MSACNTRPRLKVVRIIARLNIGGPALHVWSLSEAMASSGIETVLVVGGCEESEASYDQAHGLVPQRFRLIRLRHLKRRIEPLADLMTLFQLVAILRRERPDVVHTHTAKAGVLGRVAARLCGIRVIVHTFHGHVLHGYFSGFTSRAICLVERALARVSSALVTLSPTLRDEISGRFRIAGPEHVVVIPLGRELAPLLSAPRGAGGMRRELGLVDPRIVLLVAIGRLVPVKNYGLLLEAVARMKTSVPWRLALVGEGPCRRALEEQAARLGISERLCFLGWRTDLPRILGDSDAMIVSSRNEGTPLSMIEAFAAGCPVVATDVGGVRDLFHGEPVCQGDLKVFEEGILVQPENAVSLAAAIAGVVEERGLREKLSAAARQSARHYSIERLQERVVALYEELLENGAA